MMYGLIMSFYQRGVNTRETDYCYKVWPHNHIGNSNGGGILLRNFVLVNRDFGEILVIDVGLGSEIPSFVEHINLGCSAS